MREELLQWVYRSMTYRGSVGFSHDKDIPALLALIREDFMGAGVGQSEKPVENKVACMFPSNKQVADLFIGYKTNNTRRVFPNINELNGKEFDIEFAENRQRLCGNCDAFKAAETLGMSAGSVPIDIDCVDQSANLLFQYDATFFGGYVFNFLTEKTRLNDNYTKDLVKTTVINAAYNKVILLRAVVVAISAAQELLEGGRLEHAKSVSCVIRPPGHHAGFTAAGFCYLNNDVFLATHLMVNEKKILFVDVDYHLGDGFLSLCKPGSPWFDKFKDMFQYIDTCTISNTGRNDESGIPTNHPLQPTSFEFPFADKEQFCPEPDVLTHYWERTNKNFEPDVGTQVVYTARGISQIVAVETLHPETEEATVVGGTGMRMRAYYSLLSPIEWTVESNRDTSITIQTIQHPVYPNHLDQDDASTTCLTDMIIDRSTIVFQNKSGSIIVIAHIVGKNTTATGDSIWNPGAPRGPLTDSIAKHYVKTAWDMLAQSDFEADFVVEAAGSDGCFGDELNLGGSVFCNSGMLSTDDSLFTYVSRRAIDEKKRIVTTQEGGYNESCNRRMTFSHVCGVCGPPPSDSIKDEPYQAAETPYLRKEPAKKNAEQIAPIDGDDTDPTLCALLPKKFKADDKVFAYAETDHKYMYSGHIVKVIDDCTYEVAWDDGDPKLKLRADDVFEYKPYKEGDKISAKPDPTGTQFRMGKVVQALGNDMLEVRFDDSKKEMQVPLSDTRKPYSGKNIMSPDPQQTLKRATTGGGIFSAIASVASVASSIIASSSSSSSSSAGKRKRQAASPAFFSVDNERRQSLKAAAEFHVGQLYEVDFTPDGPFAMWYTATINKIDDEGLHVTFLDTDEAVVSRDRVRPMVPFKKEEELEAKWGNGTRWWACKILENDESERMALIQFLRDGTEKTRMKRYGDLRRIIRR